MTKLHILLFLAIDKLTNFWSYCVFRAYIVSLEHNSKDTKIIYLKQ